MEDSQAKPTVPATLAPAEPQATAAPPSPPLSDSVPKVSSTTDAPDVSTPPFSPSSQTPVLQKEQEEFDGSVDVNDNLPTSKDLTKAGELLVLDAEGQSRPFKELYDAPHTAPRQLIIFIRHFFCGNCQEYIRTLSSSISPDDLIALETPTFITIIGCGEPGLIPFYVEATNCPFPVYADPTRKLYDVLGMTRTLNLGAKPEYQQSSVMIMGVQAIMQSLGSGRKALKGGDFKQVGGEFLFENGECTWAHRMRTTRDHTEITKTRKMLGLDGTKPPLRKRWSHNVRDDKPQRRSMSWSRFRSKSKSGKANEKASDRTATPETLEERAEETVGKSIAKETAA